MQLIINTKERDKVSFKLSEGRKIVASYEADLPLTQKSDVLRHLDKFLATQKAKSSQPTPRLWRAGKLSAISLITGDGSKTGLRVGSAIAQALSLAWGIPLKTKKQKNETST
jgi:tRNA A37 threonylcarbamoyladenosine modification protein TsaB